MDDCNLGLLVSPSLYELAPRRPENQTSFVSKCSSPWLARPGEL